MPISYVKVEDCTGCYACANICPNDSIKMERDKFGFNYPVVDINTCTHCELCYKVCPEKRITQSINNNTISQSFAAWSNDEETRYNSTSGGIFSELSKKILSDGGVIVGAAYNAENLVEHIIIRDLNDLGKVRQSKYIQSDAKYIYRQIKEVLAVGKTVAFCGTPCQVAALKSYLDKPFVNLICFDFICLGVNSPKAYLAWLKELEDRHNSKVINVWFKYKFYGWKNSPRCTRIDFINGKSCMLYGDKNLFMSVYLDHHLFVRPSCCACKYKGLSRISDITLADCWGIQNILSEMDDDRGTSLVVVNSNCGQNVFNSIASKITYKEVDLEQAVKYNTAIIQSVRKNPNQEAFFADLGSLEFDLLVKKYCTVSSIVLIKRTMRRFIIGIFVKTKLMRIVTVILHKS